MADTPIAQPSAAAAPTTPPPVSAPAAAQPDFSPADIKAKNELKKEMQRVSEARAALEKEKLEIAEYRKHEALLAVDPDAFLKPRLGEKWYETLTKAKLGDDSNLAIQQLRNEFEAREKARAEADAAKAAEAKALEDEETQKAQEEAQAAIEEFRTEATEFVKAKPEEYQSIHALKLEASIAEKVQSHFQQTKKVLSHKEAADLLESELDKAVESVLATRKWQEKLGKQQTKPNTPPQLVVPRSAPSSIDNSLKAGAAPNGNRPPTKEERLAKAMARLDEWEAAKKAAQV